MYGGSYITQCEARLEALALLFLEAMLRAAGVEPPKSHVGDLVVGHAPRFPPEVRDSLPESRG
jgi:hypothetical protein